jgi:hypothetical protein
MAIYSFSGDVFTRSKGHRATAAAAYRAGVELYDHNVGERFDYHRKRGILHSEILAPEGAPEWMHDREALWNAVERQENRSNSQLARDIMIALPHELDETQRLELLRGFVREQFVDAGMVADFSIHDPSRQGDERNHHAHIMLTLRRVDGDGFAAKKEREWNRRELMEQWREAWAEHCNAALEAAGFDEGTFVDHRSLEAQGIDRMAGKHKGKAATAAERRGEVDERLEDIEARHREYDALIEELAHLDAAIEAEQEHDLDARFGSLDEQSIEDAGMDDPAEVEDQDAEPDLMPGLIEFNPPAAAPGPKLTDEELRQARDAVAHAEATGPVSPPDQAWEPRAWPGMSWLHRAAVRTSQLAEQVKGFVADRWQKYVEWRDKARQIDRDDGPDLSR